MAGLETLLSTEQTNAAIGWLFVGCLLVVALWSLLSTQRLWGIVPLSSAAIVALPAITTGDWTLMVPWPLVAVLTAGSAVGAGGVAVELVGAAVIATLAVVGTVELSVFTTVDMSRRFAVVFAVLTTMAMQAVVVVVQFAVDAVFGTELLGDLRELQWDFVAVTAVAIALGITFARYFETAGDHESTHRPNVEP